MHTRFAFALVAGALISIIPTSAQSTDSPSPLHPRTALKRALVPGWGQLSNRQYYKIPVVYAGLAGFAGAALVVNQRYLLYRHAFLYTARTEADGSPVFPEYASDYAELIRHLNLAPEENLSPEDITARRNRLEPQLRNQRDALRRNRDLLYFAAIGWYGLSILDAFVSAHLLDFDVSESLSVRAYAGPDRAAIIFQW